MAASDSAARAEPWRANGTQLMARRGEVRTHPHNPRRLTRTGGDVFTHLVGGRYRRLAGAPGAARAIGAAVARVRRFAWTERPHDIVDSGHQQVSRERHPDQRHHPQRATRHGRLRPPARHRRATRAVPHAGSRHGCPHDAHRSQVPGHGRGTSSRGPRSEAAHRASRERRRPARRTRPWTPRRPRSAPASRPDRRTAATAWWAPSAPSPGSSSGASRWRFADGGLCGRVSS